MSGETLHTCSVCGVVGLPPEHDCLTHLLGEVTDLRHQLAAVQERADRAEAIVERNRTEAVAREELMGLMGLRYRGWRGEKRSAKLDKGEAK